MLQRSNQGQVRGAITVTDIVVVPSVMAKGKFTGVTSSVPVPTFKRFTVIVLPATVTSSRESGAEAKYFPVPPVATKEALVLQVPIVIDAGTTANAAAGGGVVPSTLLAATVMVRPVVSVIAIGASVTQSTPATDTLKTPPLAKTMTAPLVEGIELLACRKKATDEFCTV